MPNCIPILAAKKFCEEQDLRHVIICAWDGKLSHVVTYGRTIEDCAQAAEGGNRVKLLLGWPENLQAEPSRARKLRVDGVRKGYEDCAILLDGIALFWKNGAKPGHELVADVMTDMEKQIRLLKESI